MCLKVVTRLQGLTLMFLLCANADCALQFVRLGLFRVSGGEELVTSCHLIVR
jgi:hypothetical protein